MAPFQILPVETKFYDLFEEGTENAVDAALLLCTMLEDGSGTWEASVARMGELEHKGDAITHAIFDLLHKTFVTPFDHEEIHGLAVTIDDVVDLIHAAADALLMYKITEVKKPARDLALIARKATEEIEHSIRCLRKKKTLKCMLPRVTEINRLENEADQIIRAGVVALVEQRGDTFEFIRWKEIYEHIEDAVDRCEDIAGMLRTIVIKYA